MTNFSDVERLNKHISRYRGQSKADAWLAGGFHSAQDIDANLEYDIGFSTKLSIRRQVSPTTWGSTSSTHLFMRSSPPQTELIRALTAEVRGLAAIVNERLPPPGPPPPTSHDQTLRSTQGPDSFKAPPKPSAQTPSFASIHESSREAQPRSSPLPLTPLLLRRPQDAVGDLRPLERRPVRPPPGFFPGCCQMDEERHLVIVACPDTTSQHLQKTSAALSNGSRPLHCRRPLSARPISAKRMSAGPAS
ncbi:hypothetical protein EDB85DRAFT_2145104 [Lactarius pseudohatsudake]|nr:hypothetical protein EDB85DRAFT_2145104 [Lactarius pseudohatsudake]